MDKGKALDAALSQIERAFGKGSIMRMGARQEKQGDVEVVSTGSLGLDLALGIGGLPKGRIVEIYGPESSGKTTLALHVIAEAQKRGGTCAFIDAEHAMDPGYAKKLGVDVEHDENEFLDYNREPLMPHRLSTEGPGLAVGDVNGDGLDDLYVGGGKWQPGALIVQQRNGTFRASRQPGIAADSVAARITMAEPGMPCAPLEVTSATARMPSRSAIASGVLVAWAINTAASVR